jgi:hypothetical protein
MNAYRASRHDRYSPSSDRMGRDEGLAMSRRLVAIRSNARGAGINGAPGMTTSNSEKVDPNEHDQNPGSTNSSRKQAWGSAPINPLAERGEPR